LVEVLERVVEVPQPLLLNETWFRIVRPEAGKLTYRQSFQTKIHLQSSMLLFVEGELLIKRHRDNCLRLR
jgi:hypothetical protein